MTKNDFKVGDVHETFFRHKFQKYQRVIFRTVLPLRGNSVGDLTFDARLEGKIASVIYVDGKIFYDIERNGLICFQSVKESDIFQTAEEAFNAED